MDVLRAKVLVINKAWQGYEETSVMVAICDMVRGACTGIDTERMKAVTWE